MYRNTLLALAVAGGIAVFAATQVASPWERKGETNAEPTASYIVQGASLPAIKAAIHAVGGEVTDELSLIDAAGAMLSQGQIESLTASHEGITFFPDGAVTVAGDIEETFYPSLIGAKRLHEAGISGNGVTIAVLDTGLWKKTALSDGAHGRLRILAQYDAITDGRDYKVDLDDYSGHGTHVTSIAISSDMTERGNYQGVAPNANLVAVRAFSGDGTASYIDVIRGIEWIVAKKSRYDIKVLNLSFSATPRSHYWDDPINQAVMAAWQAGIVVVASAGNVGPDPMTVGVPGNVPYVITVGAMSDSYTPRDPSDDVLATFSATGPTAEGFVKPEVVAPGGHMLGWMPPHGSIPQNHPEFMHEDEEYFTMSGTSQSAAVVSGAAALLLQAQPWLSPDDVKCRLMASARPAVNENGALAYSVFQQGAGMIDVYGAVYSTASGCANRGLDIDMDIAGQRHFGGRANIDENGNYYLMGLDGYLWGDQGVTANGFLWSDEHVWADGYLWTDAYLWSDNGVWTNGFLWSDEGVGTNGYLWSDSNVGTNGFLWSNLPTSTVGINTWVEQE